MDFLCDTTIIGGLSQKEPDPGLLSWAEGVRHVALSVISIEEIYYGLSWKPNDRVQAWFNDFFARNISVLPVTGEIARQAGLVRGRLKSQGLTRTQADILIAATALHHGLTLVTRNTRDFEGCGVTLLNPFTG